MARRGLSAGMSGREKALGGAVLALYLAVLPYVSGPALDLLERLLGTRLGESVRNAIYYYVVFALVVIVFWGYLGRTTRAFLDRPGGVLASAGLGLVAFYGLNEICGRLLGLALEGQVNLNDEAIVGRMVDAPRTTILIVVVLAPVVEETLFRGYVFGNLREVHRGLAYLVSCLLFALLHVWQFAAARGDLTYLLLMVQYLVPGAVMAWTYERSGSLWGSVLLHGVVNGLAVVRVL